MKAKITTKDIERMLFEQGWIYNLKIGQLIVNDKGEDGGSGKRTDTATIRFNEKHCEWELKVSHNGKYKRIARARYFLNNSDTKVIGTIFDKENNND